MDGLTGALAMLAAADAELFEIIALSLRETAFLTRVTRASVFKNRSTSALGGVVLVGLRWRCFIASGLLLVRIVIDKRLGGILDAVKFVIINHGRFNAGVPRHRAHLLDGRAVPNGVRDCRVP